MLQKINILKTRLYLLMAHEVAMCIHNKNKYTIYLIIMRKINITSGACETGMQRNQDSKSLWDQIFQFSNVGFVSITLTSKHTQNAREGKLGICENLLNIFFTNPL